MAYCTGPCYIVGARILLPSNLVGDMQSVLFAADTLHLNDSSMDFGGSQTDAPANCLGILSEGKSVVVINSELSHLPGRSGGTIGGAIYHNYQVFSH